MSRVDIPLVESPGIIRDIEPYRLPPGAWSDGSNVLFKDRKVQKAFGYSVEVASPTISPRGLFFCPLRENGLWVYPGLTAVYAFDMDATTADITRAAGAYTGGESNIWEFAYLHGIGIFTNGVDTVQQWTPSLSNDLVALSNWPANYTCKIIRTFKNFLVALDVTKSTGTRYPELVFWSHPADPGAVPSSWDITDATKQAGEFPLSKSPGAILGAEMLGDNLIIYKESSVWRMGFVGLPLVMGFVEIFPNFGALSTKSVVPCKKGHFVVTKDDVIVHNGSQAVSILNAIDRKWLFDNLEFGGILYCHALYWASRSEVWFFFPTTGQGTANSILIWNEETNSVTFRTPSANIRASCYTPAVAISAGDTWDGESALQWGSNSQIWDDNTLFGVRQRTLFVDPATDKIMEWDQSLYTDNAVNFTSYIERRDMPFVMADDNGLAVAEVETVKLFKECWPRVSGTSGDIVYFQFAVKMNPEDTLTWSTAVAFTIGTTQILPINLSGRFLSIKMYDSDDNGWEFHGFSYEAERMGML